MFSVLDVLIPPCAVQLEFFFKLFDKLKSSHWLHRFKLQNFDNFFKSNLSLYSLYYAKACNEFVGPISASLRLATQLLSKKCCSGSKPLTTLCLIWPVRDLNLRSPVPETNPLPLDQLAGIRQSLQPQNIQHSTTQSQRHHR